MNSGAQKETPHFSAGRMSLFEKIFPFVYYRDMEYSGDKLNIGFDMDGVLLDNTDSKIRVAKRFGLKIKLDHTPSEILKTLMPQVVWEEFQNMLYDHPKFAYSTPLMRGTRAILAKLVRKKIPIF